MVKVVTNGQGKVYTANGKALISPAASPVITSLNVTPTTSAQTITAPSGTDGYSPVNVAAVTASIDANITAGNIKKDVTILNVTGTYEGSGGGSKYGANADTFLGDVNASGVLQLPTEQSELVFTGVKNIAAYALYYKFIKCQVKSVSFPELTGIGGSYGMGEAFRECAPLTTVSFPKLTTIGNYSMYQAFYSCTSLTTVSFPELTSTSNSYAMGSIFERCTSLTTVSFPKLTTIGSYCMGSAFSYCSKLANIYFNKVTTSTFASVKNQFNNMFNSSTASTSGTVNVHFPSNLSSTVSGLTGYPTFGGNSSRVVLKFDLTATS